MEMCYDGALVMPSNYVVMDEEEMTYVEGGGTFGVNMNKAAVKYVVQTGSNCLFMAVQAAMGATGIGAAVCLAVTNIAYSYMLDNLVKVKAIKKSWTKSWIPFNYTFKWHM